MASELTRLFEQAAFTLHQHLQAMNEKYGPASLESASVQIFVGDHEVAFTVPYILIEDFAKELVASRPAEVRDFPKKEK